MSCDHVVHKTAVRLTRINAMKDKCHAISRNADWFANLYRFVGLADCSEPSDIHVTSERTY
jgi:hypothetical protein